MKIIKILTFVLFLHGIASLSFAAGVTAPTADDYFANVAYCNDPTHNCTAAQIGTSDGGTSAWVTNGSSTNGTGILCSSGQVWSSSLGMCISSSTAANNSCTYMSGTSTITQVHGATWACACSDSTVNLATCTCNNGTVTRSESGCGKFTKYQVCPSNQCKTQTGSCYINAPTTCVWESCASATSTSLGSTSNLDSAASASTITKTLP